MYTYGGPDRETLARTLTDIYQTDPEYHYGVVLAELKTEGLGADIRVFDFLQTLAADDICAKALVALEGPAKLWRC